MDNNIYFKTLITIYYMILKNLPSSLSRAHFSTMHKTK